MEHINYGYENWNEEGAPPNYIQQQANLSKQKFRENLLSQAKSKANLQQIKKLIFSQKAGTDPSLTDLYQELTKGG